MSDLLTEPDLYRPQNYHPGNPFVRRIISIPEVELKDRVGRSIFGDHVRDAKTRCRVICVVEDRVNRVCHVELDTDKVAADQWENDFGYLYRI